MQVLREVAEKLGLNEDALIIYEGSSELLSTLLAGRDCAAHYCRQRLFDCPVISTSDYITYGFLSYTKEQGLEAGRDFQLISYDNLEAELKNPSLKLGFSAITHPLKNACEALVDLAENLMRKREQNQKYHQVYMVPAKELVLRSSS